MTPLLETIVSLAKSQITNLLNQTDELSNNPLWSDLFAEEYLKDAFCTFNGLVLVPNGDPWQLMHRIQRSFDIMFLRDIQQSGSYHWVGTLDKINLIIEADEILDLTGTQPHKYIP